MDSSSFLTADSSWIWNNVIRYNLRRNAQRH